MLVGFYSTASGLEAAERMHDVIAENLAHASVPGYRAHVLTQETFERALAGQLDSLSAEGHGTLVSEVTPDFTKGPTAQTGRSLDLAIAGNAFFEVQGPNGPLFTRNGVFFLNDEGQIINSEGMLLQGTNGPLTVPQNATSEQIVVASDGSVSVDGNPIGQIQLAHFGDSPALQRMGPTLFAAAGGVIPDEGNSTVMQGVRELSNVTVVNEMVRMIWGMRHYEAAQKALSTLDEAIGQVTDPQS